MLHANWYRNLLLPYRHPQRQHRVCPYCGEADALVQDYVDIGVGLQHFGPVGCEWCWSTDNGPVEAFSSADAKSCGLAPGEDYGSRKARCHKKRRRETKQLRRQYAAYLKSFRQTRKERSKPYSGSDPF